MNAEHVLALLENVDEPLQLGLRTANSLSGWEQRLSLLTGVLARFGWHPTVTAMREMACLTDGLTSNDPQLAQELLAALTNNTPAAQYMRAMLLEAAGRYREAATILWTLPDNHWGEERALRLLACARNLVKAGVPVDAWWALREVARTATSYRTLAAVDRLISHLKRDCSPPHKRRCRVAVVGNSTLDFLLPVLRACSFAVGIDAEVYQGAFGQYQQEILDPHSGLAAFKPDIVIIATDWRSLGLPDEADDPSALSQATVAMFQKLWRCCRDSLGAFVIQHNFEIPASDPYGRLSAALKGGRGRLLRRINLDLWDVEQQEPGVAILDLEQAAGVYGKRAWHDPVLWHAAKQHPAPDAIPQLARHQVALLRAILGLTAKCLVLDLDGTIWGGVVGEGGLAGITLGGSGVGEAYVAFQRYVQSLQRRGIVLAVCSKNNQEDAELPFRMHPEMVLSLDDITCFVANWQTKDANLRLIAESINVGLDSLVFVDDSPMERAWVRAQLPEVEVPEMPEDPALYVEALHQGMYFEALSLTQDDRRRIETYRANLERRALQLSSSSLEQFLAELQMCVELQPFDELNVPRIAQLINKTNQFNLTTRRRPENQVRSLIGQPSYYTQAMRLRDRFGDNGLTGVLIAVQEGASMRIDTWLLSCRVLGRQVERVMLAALVRHALDRGLSFLIGEYIPSEKNGQVSDLFDRLGFERVADGPQGERTYRLDLSQVRPESPAYVEVHDGTQDSGHYVPPQGHIPRELPVSAQR